jgi:hypothetical protein
MTEWMFRVKGQPYLSGGLASAQYHAQIVKDGSANGKPVVELYRTGHPAPSVTFAPDAIFGYIVEVEGQIIKVWRRDPTQVGESELRVPVGLFIKPGKLGSLDTWDIFDRDNDPGSIVGRILADWVSEYRDCSWA